jgi:hypothetical protein
MATILNCPRCQQAMDVTGVSPGTTVRCPDCGQMAKVPTGATSLSVKTVSAPIPAVNSPRTSGGTRIRERSRSGQVPAVPAAPKSNSGLFVGLAIGAIGILVVAFAFMANRAPDAPPRRDTAPKGGGQVTFSPKLPPSSDKPIVLGEGKSELKPTVLSKPAESAENANWDQLMQQLRPGGGFDHPDRPEGMAFLKVKSFGKAAYPKLIKYIDDEDTALGKAAAAVLNELSGRDVPLPSGVSKAKVKAEWEEWWLKEGSTSAPKPEEKK